MKTLLTLSFVVFMFVANAQYSHKKRQRNPSEFGAGLTIGGAGLLTLSLTTTPIYNWTSTTSNYNSSSISNNSVGAYSKQPFLNQGAKSYGIITGVTLTLTGIITILSGN